MRLNSLVPMFLVCSDEQMNMLLAMARIKGWNFTRQRHVDNIPGMGPLTLIGLWIPCPVMLEILGIKYERLNGWAYRIVK